MKPAPGTSRIAWNRLKPFVDRLAAQDETEAVVVLSNAAGAPDRLPFDKHSDFDLAVVLDVPVAPDEWRPEPYATYSLIASRLPRWLPNFSFHVPVPWGSLEVNLHQLIYDYEADPRTRWDDAKCEAYGGTAELVYDCIGRFRALVRAKVDQSAQSRPDRIAWLANRLDWDIAILPRRQADRGELAAAHYIVGRAIEEVLEFCFLSADRFVPSQKWRFFVLREQGLLAYAELEQLMQALSCNPASRGDLERRISALSEAWASIRERSPELAVDPYQAFAASQLQITSVTFADEIRERLGETAYDVVNYLLADSFEALLSARLPDDSPDEWFAELLRVRALICP